MLVLDLSPAKILVILVVALVVLGPDKLPGLARQMGALWGDLRRLRSRLENEVRGVFPELPPTHEITQAVRSPLTYLNRLADEHEELSGGDAVASVSTDGAGDRRAPPGTVNGSSSPGTVWLPGPGDGGDPLPSVPDDPSMN